MRRLEWAVSAVVVGLALIYGCARTIVLESLPRPQLNSPNLLRTVQPALRFFVPALRDATRYQGSLLIYGSEPARILLNEPIGGLVAKTFEMEVARNGHVVAPQRDSADVIILGVVWEYVARFGGPPAQPSRLSGHVTADLSVVNALTDAVLVAKKFQGTYRERQVVYWFGLDLSPIKNALDHALRDMLEQFFADEDVSAAFQSFKRP